MWILKFWVQGLCSWILDPGSWVLGAGSSGCMVLSPGSRVPVSGSRVPGASSWVLGPHFRLCLIIQNAKKHVQSLLFKGSLMFLFKLTFKKNEKIKQRKLRHNNNFWWKLKQSPIVLKSSYFEKFWKILKKSCVLHNSHSNTTYNCNTKRHPTKMILGMAVQ